MVAACDGCRRVTIVHLDEGKSWLCFQCYVEGGTNMKIGSAFPSRYLKKEDLQGRRVKLQIERVELEDVAGDGSDPKPVIYFVGKQKAMVLNRTNAARLENAYGDETDDWTGKEVTLYADMSVTYMGKRVGGLAVDVPQPEPETIGDDEVPF